MEVKEFLNKYINENILELFEVTCEMFSKELPKELVEDCDVEEVILETKGHQEMAKNFDNVIYFTQLLQDKQPELYKKNFQYFDDFLIDYYSFHNDRAKVESAFVNFNENPLHDFDMYLNSFKKLIFNEQTGLINKTISKNFDEIAFCDDLIGTAEYDLAIGKMYITLQELYLEFTESNKFDRDRFYDILIDYGFNMDEDFLSIETGICENIADKEDLADLFVSDRKSTREVILGNFLKYMYKRNFSFVLSGRIWDKMLGLWDENAKGKNKKLNPNIYFNTGHKEFEKYLAWLAGDMFIDNKQEMVATLWGSVYVYDFLKSIDLIDQKVYDSFIEVSRSLKGIVIGQFTTNLWNNEFVHRWTKPDGISENEFNEEKKIFRKSILFKPEKFSVLKNEIASELEAIGELAEYIEEGVKQEAAKPDLSFKETYNDLIQNFYNDDFESPKKEKETAPLRLVDPGSLGQKVGRNDPCTCGSGKKYKRCCG